jgi:O-antigen/teichoic acid export membrane protein
MGQSTEDQNIEHGKHVSANHVLKYTGIFGGVQGITMLVSIVRNKLVAVLIGQVGLGIIDIFNRTLDLVGNTTNFGVSFSAVQHISSLYGKSNDDEIRHYVCVVRSWALLTALFGMAICLIFSPIISLITFGDLSRTATFCMLAPIVGMMAINGGEMAILKGLRRLRRIVVVSTLIVLTTLVSTVPFYWRWGISGIVPALLLSNACGMLIQLLYTHKVIPWHVSFSKDVFGEGYDMIRLGVAYILAGVLGSGAEMAVRVLLRHWGDFNDVGLYAAGTTLIVAYAGLIFKALDTDYFPRLSSICNDVPKANAAICQQLEVCVLLIIPLLILFMLAVPFIVPLLYTGKFVPAVPMVICASFYLFSNPYRCPYHTFHWPRATPPYTSLWKLATMWLS